MKMTGKTLAMFVLIAVLVVGAAVGAGFVQPPTMSEAGIDNAAWDMKVEADDWQGDGNNVTCIRIWGSWGTKNGKDLMPDDSSTFTLKFWIGTSPSSYDSPWKTLTFGPGKYIQGLYTTLSGVGKWWWDPGMTPSVSSDVNKKVYQYDFELGTDAFLASNPTTYWLGVQNDSGIRFNWTDSQEGLLGTAEYYDTGGPPGAWQNLQYPSGHPLAGSQMSLAFEINPVSCPSVDLTGDCFVDMKDLALFASEWLWDDCIAPDWCGKADIDTSGKVNFLDFAIIASQWFMGNP